MVPRTLESGAFHAQEWEKTDCIAGEAVKDAVFWPLSIAEAGEVERQIRGIHSNDWAIYYWWLRSPGGDSSYGERKAASYVSYDGSVCGTARSCPDWEAAYIHPNIGNGHTSAYWYGVRPAVYLDPDDVLFTSVAEGGKAGEVGALSAVGSYRDGAWKLTLLDQSRNFAVTETAARGNPGGSVTLHYTGAVTGEREYISVILLDEQNIPLYYGRVAKPDAASGQISVPIPGELQEGSYNLNVFSEQCNGDKRTDCASAFAQIALTVDRAPVVTAPDAPQQVAVAAGDQAVLRVTAENADAYQWYVDRGDGCGFAALEGATAPAYTTGAVTLENDGYTYVCHARNAHGTAYSPAFTLLVYDIPVLPQTGDSGIARWAALALLSGAGALGWARRRRD